MRKFFVLLLIAACALLCGCKEETPIATTASEVTAECVTTVITEDTSFVATEKATDATQPRRKIVSPICNIDWVRAATVDGDYYFENASMEIEYEFPSDWSRVSGAYISFDDDKFYTDIDAYFLGEECPLSELPLPEVTGDSVELIDTLESEKCLIRIYEAPYYGHKYFIYAYIRCDGYAIGFKLHSTSQSTEIFDVVADSLSVTREPDVKTYTEFVQTDNELCPVNIGNLFYLHSYKNNKPVMEYLPIEWNIEINLPKSWTKLKHGQSTAEFTPEHIIYSRYGFPTGGVSPNGCMYQAFCGYNVYTSDTVELYGTKGKTQSGNEYWIEKKTLTDYHAVDSSILVKLSEEYYYRFSLCVDVDDTALIESVIDSVRLLTEPSNLKASGTLILPLSWVNSYFYRIGTEAKPVSVSISVPANFKVVSDNTFVSLTEKAEIKILYELYKTDGTIPPDSLPRPAVGAAKHLKSIEFPDIVADVYTLYYPDDNNGYTTAVAGYGLADGYAIPFEFRCIGGDFDTIPSLISAISVTEPSEAPKKNADDVMLDEELSAIKITDLFCINRITMSESFGEHLPKDFYIELCLPASWQHLGKDTDMTNSVYSELGIPHFELSPEKCIYQGFASDCLYTEETSVAGGSFGTTDSGNEYWFTKTAYDYYHAIEYDVSLRISDEYIYRFTLCVDKDNTDLVEKVINSVTLVYNTEEYTVAANAKCLAKHIVTFAMTEEWLDGSYLPTDSDIFSFLVSLCMYRDNDTHPYGDRISISDDGQSFAISYSDAEKMICEVFGDRNLAEVKELSEIFDPDTESYRIPRGIGLWTSAFSFEILSTDVQNEYVTVKGLLMGSEVYEYEDVEPRDVEIKFERTQNSRLKYKSIELQ